MTVRCLIVDNNVRRRDQLRTLVREILKVDAECTDTLRDVLPSIDAKSPNLILLRFTHASVAEHDVLKTIQRKTPHVTAIALIEQVRPEQIRSLSRTFGVADVLMDDAPRTRIQRALRDAADALVEECDGVSYYRGFFGFVACVPALWERKILSNANIGLILNRSLRLAIDYWRMNPDSQLVAICINANETFTSRQRDNLGTWVKLGIRPWEIGMFEAQRHYLEYWKEPIQSNLMPGTIPTLLREGTHNLSVVDPDTQKSILVRMQELSTSGKLDEVMSSVGVSFRSQNLAGSEHALAKFIEKLEQQMREVDRRHPRLTRPPTETGYEGFVPDKAGKHEEDGHRMAFIEKERGR